MDFSNIDIVNLFNFEMILYWCRSIQKKNLPQTDQVVLDCSVRHIDEVTSPYKFTAEELANWRL